MDVPYIGVGDNSLEEKEVNEWMRIGLRLGIVAGLHPFDYAKVLMQLGYEPIVPRPGRSIWGKHVMVLPNIFEYTGYIRRVDGFYGCYRGLAPKLFGSLLSTIVSEKIKSRLEFSELENKEVDEDDLTDQQLYERFKLTLKRDLLMATGGIIVSQPFHVVSVRMMAQFIGREQLYTSILGSLREIYQTNGVWGFFSGLTPKLICELAIVLLSSTSVYLLNKYYIKDKMTRQYNAGITQFVFASFMYPLQVVATCMTVTGSRLMAGMPPVMPEYKSWTSCFDDLHRSGDLKRGSTIFWRTIAFNNKEVRREVFPPLPTLSKYT